MARLLTRQLTVHCTRSMLRVSTVSSRIPVHVFSRGFCVHPRESPGVTPDDEANAGGSVVQDSSKMKIEREDILAAGLEHVQVLGWSSDAIARGCSEVGLSVASVGMFSNGAGDLVSYFLERCNSELDGKLTDLKERRPSAEERFSGMGEEERTETRTTEKLAAAVQMRLEMVLPYIDTWPQAMAVGALPQNCVQTMKLNAALMDIIWHHVGDQTQSLEWYSKRAALGAVYAATELHLLTDKSEGHQATWNFLGGRLKELEYVGKQLNDMSRNSRVMQDLFASSIDAAQAAMDRNDGNKDRR